MIPVAHHIFPCFPWICCFWDIFVSPEKPRMNAKSWGPLWHIHPEEAETPIFEEFLSKPAMVLGINIYQTSLGCWEIVVRKPK